ncbi:MAG: DUF2339 domain-containing protein [Lentisphaeria bacterium]|nr:DUF2339 domain-containing protein [Lentisphaeria bacterium]
MEIFFGVLILGLVLAWLSMPVWVLVKLTKIEKHLSGLENRLPKAEKPEIAVQQKPAAPLPSGPASPPKPVERKKEEPLSPPEPEMRQKQPAEPKAPPKPVKHPRVPGNLEIRTREVLRKIWNFIIVGEEFRNPDVTREYAVATTWLIRIGIIILLCGIGFFLKYSIEHSWLSPAVRVSLMVLSGLVMTGIGLWKSSGKYRPFMIALTGAGFVTLYLSIMAAYRLYHLIQPMPAFGAMAVVTVAAMATALGMNALFPALLGCAGGFLTPLFIDTGSHDLSSLFLYMTMLTAGTLFTAFYRSWILLHLSAFLLYALLGGVAVTKYMDAASAPSVLIMLSIDFALFSLMALGTARRRDATILELLLLLANAAFYFFAAVPAAQNFYAEWKIAAALPLWAAGLGVLQSRIAVRRIEGERPFFQMFLAAQTAFSLALAVPLLLGGVWIVTAWSVLAFLMLGMGLRSKSRTLLIMSFILYAVTQYVLFTSETFFRDGSPYTAVLLHHLLGAGVMTASWTAAAVLLFRTKDFSWAAPSGRFSLPKLQTGVAVVFAVIAGTCFLCYSSYEWHLCMRTYWRAFQDGILVLWWSLLILAGVVVYRKRPSLPFFMPVLVILGILSLIRLVQMPWPDPEVWIKNAPCISPKPYGEYILTSLLTRWIYVVSLTAAGIELARQHAPKKVFVSVLMLSGVLFFLFSSMEIRTALAYFLYGFRNGGVSVWWSLCAVSLVFSGIRWRLKALRIAGIALFAVCAGKVFFADLDGLDQIWRIAAFALIGIVMLSGAVLYIRFKDLFTEKKDTPS